MRCASAFRIAEGLAERVSTASSSARTHRLDDLDDRRSAPSPASPMRARQEVMALMETIKLRSMNADARAARAGQMDRGAGRAARGHDVIAEMSRRRSGRHRTSDSFPVVLPLTAFFVLMFLANPPTNGSSTHGSRACRAAVRRNRSGVVERFSASRSPERSPLRHRRALLPPAAEFAAQSAAKSNGIDRPGCADPGAARRLALRRHCRIFLGRWDPIALKRGKLIWTMRIPRFAGSVARHIRQLAADGTLPNLGRKRGHWRCGNWCRPSSGSIIRSTTRRSWMPIRRLLHALPCNGGGGHAAAIGELMTSKASVDAFCAAVAL